VLIGASATNGRLGHENLGFLSESHGFLPVESPLRRMPGSHRAWDEAADSLPDLVRTLRLREALAAMPVLGASDGELPDRYLMRASVVLSMLAHAFKAVETDPTDVIPEAVDGPWRQITRRLDRPAPHISFFDMAYNWALIDVARPDRMRVDNLRLLVPMIGNEDERRFQMTPIESLAVTVPAVAAVVRAQEALTSGDLLAARREVLLIAELVHELTAVTFPKVDPNEYSENYVSPVVWGKTVAPFTTPFESGVPASGGTGIPTFRLLDIFFGRHAYGTSIGEETALARRWLPAHWRAFLEAVEMVPSHELVAKSGDRVLRGLFREALEAYAGRNGFLGRHRTKVYGYLDLSFKAGRTKTLGGFEGGFAARVWDRTDAELELARHERYGGEPATWHYVQTKEVRQLGNGETPASHVVLDVEGRGIRYPSGSRLAVLPENRAELVERTLRSLRARGDEPIALDAAWREGVKARAGYETARVLSLATLIRFGRIRPVDRRVAKLLHSITLSHSDGRGTR
jgi:sulfite reductase (NADPH) flavoprotein alpha-component